MDLTNFYGFVKKMVHKNQYTYNVPPGSSILTLTARREAPSLMGLMGRVGRVGRVDGWDGPEKCPLIFFILCEYIDYVYVYLYTK